MGRIVYKRKKTTSTSSQLVEYPSGDPKFKDPMHLKRYNALKNKEFIVGFSVCEKAIVEAGIEDGLASILESGKLGILMEHQEVGEYFTPTIEFISSFHEYVEDDGKLGWEFRLGGENFRKSKEDICALFKFSSHGIHSEYSVEERDDFWNEISGFVGYTPHVIPKNIKVGVWIYIHRLIAARLLTRLEVGRFVQGQDLDVMRTLSKGLEVDAYFYLTKMFYTCQGDDGEGHLVGGGFFVTLIAHSLGFDLSTAGNPFHKPLTIKQLVAFKVWDKKGKTWVHEPNYSTRVIDELTRRMERKAKDSINLTRKTKGIYMPLPPHLTGESSHHNGGDHENDMDELAAIKSRLSNLENLGDEIRTFMKESKARDELILATLASLKPPTRASASDYLPDLDFLGEDHRDDPNV